MKLTREELLMKLGAARQQASSAWRLVDVELAEAGTTLHPRRAKQSQSLALAFCYRLSRDKLRHVRRREGRYLLRTTLTETDPAKLWSFYLQLIAVEEAFKNLKGDLAIRPIFHQLDRRIEEAHIFVAFSPTVCTPHSADGCASLPRGRPRAVCWRSLLPCR